jgi:hypothetical protein
MEAPDHRGAELPGIVSLNVQALFPDMDNCIYDHKHDTSLVEAAAEKALSRVDMKKIKPDHTVNILCDEHGFVIQGGKPYLAVLKKVKDAVEANTGCKKIRLVFCAGVALAEAREGIELFGLDKFFGKHIRAASPFGKGVAIETDIGILYGVANVYDADWFVHVTYDDPREIYFHRAMNRSLKAFAMGYARYETRSIYHMNFGNRSSNIVPRAIFDSPFVQERYAFTCSLTSSPAGITGVDADNDLYALDRRTNVNILKSYGKMMSLYNKIDSCIMVLDGERWPWYVHGAGVIAGFLLKGPVDFLDLSVGSPDNQIVKKPNPAVKALVINYCYPVFFTDLAEKYPTIIVGDKAAGAIEQTVKKHGVVADNLSAAVSFAQKMSQTENVLIFDGSFGHLNLTPSMGEFLMEKAPEVSKEVDQNRLPLWLSQRGIDPGIL